MRVVRLLIMLAMMGGAATPLRAQEPQGCEVPDYLLASESRLPRSAAAKQAGKLDILVIGSRSATLNPPEQAFPARLEASLRARWPQVQVSVATDLRPKKTAEEVASELGPVLAQRKPTLVIWQTGTVDAMMSVDQDEFRAALDDGVRVMQQAGSDVILMNLQYSPRTETVISASSYIDNMRVVAQQHEAPLFDRFAIMRYWSESGDFDLSSTSTGPDLARRVHDCLARALSSLIAAAIVPPEPETRTQQ
jgi:hypothetical protein